jgi:ABC-type transporter Mla subunit MlaD
MFNAIIYKINATLEGRLLFITEQSITERQLSVQQNSLEELRLFNSNISMKIGDAVRTAIQGSNDALTNKLSDIAESFAKLVTESGAGAGKALNEAMKDALDSSLNQASESIRAVTFSLQDLPTQLSAAASEIRSTGSAAINEHLRLTEGVQRGVDELLRNAGAHISSNIERGTEGLIGNLRETGSAFGASAEKIGAFFERFAAKGDEYINSLASISSQTSAFESRFSNLCSDIVGATSGLNRANTAVGDNLSQLTRAIAEFGRVATDTTQSVRASQDVIKATVETLQRQMSLHVERFDNVDERLASVFNNISSHLELQSKQMFDQLSRMDHALARAVNHFEQLIDDLTGIPQSVAAE